MIDPAVRPPAQQRSRDGWERILSVGLELLTTGGAEALTVSEVCRRAGVSAPSLYARVDGRAGLFSAVYERGIELVFEAEVAVRERFASTDQSLAGQVHGVVAGLATLFDEQAPFLRAVIQHSSVDPVFRARGATEARRVVDGLVAALPGEDESARAVATTLFAECVVRTQYGNDFFDPKGESLGDFIGRLSTLAMARLAH